MRAKLIIESIITGNPGKIKNETHETIGLRTFYNYIVDYLLIDDNPTVAVGFLNDVEDEIEEKYNLGLSIEETVNQLKNEYSNIYNYYKQKF